MGVGSWVYCASLDCRRSCVNSALKSCVEHHIPGNHDMHLFLGGFPKTRSTLLGVGNIQGL